MYQQIALPPLGRVNKFILIAWVVLFVGEAILRLLGGPMLTSFFALTPGRVVQGEIYQLLTYPFFHLQLWDLLLHALVLVFMGNHLESTWGEKKYIKFLSGGTLVVGLFYVSLGLLIPSFSYHPLYGPGCWFFAMACAFALVSPHSTFSFLMIFPLKAWVAVALLLAIEVYSSLFGPLKGATLANLLGALWAFLWVKVPTLRFQGKIKYGASRKRSGKLRLVSSDQKGPDDADALNKKGPKYWQ